MGREEENGHRPSSNDSTSPNLGVPSRKTRRAAPRRAAARERADRTKRNHTTTHSPPLDFTPKSSMYSMATLPSMLPTAIPTTLLSFDPKNLTHLVWYFSDDSLSASGSTSTIAAESSPPPPPRQ